MIAQIRKALIAAVAAFLTGFAPAWAQAGGFPGWSTVGGLAIFAALAGAATWAVPNKRAPIPKVAAHLKVEGGPNLTPAMKAAVRAAARMGPPTK